jgi:hypothetical protein
MREAVVSRGRSERAAGGVASDLLLRSNSPPPPSPPAEKATACEDQTGQSSTSDGTGNSGRIGYEILLDLRNRATASGGCGNKQAHSN